MFTIARTCRPIVRTVSLRTKAFQYRSVRQSSAGTQFTTAARDHSKIGSIGNDKRKWVKPKIKQRKHESDEATKQCICKTFATAEKYNMQALVAEMLEDHRIAVEDLPADFYGAANMRTTDQGLVCNPHFPGDIFVFRDGTITFWNIRAEETKRILRVARNHGVKIYSSHLVAWESEEVAYTYEPGPSKLQRENFTLSTDSNACLALDMFALSNALAVSVKLAHWEHLLDGLITSIESVPEELMKGRNLKYQTPGAVLRKIGEILLIRQRVNLQYNILDVPDTYWDHEHLEKLYVTTTRFLNINRRVHLMNEKLTYCAHMAELLKTDLHERRSLRVEILIVILISIEVVFEILHIFILPYIDAGKTQSSPPGGSGPSR